MEFLSPSAAHLRYRSTVAAANQADIAGSNATVVCGCEIAGRGGAAAMA
jgi:hypothetical protein